MIRQPPMTNIMFDMMFAVPRTYMEFWSRAVSAAATQQRSTAIVPYAKVNEEQQTQQVIGVGEEMLDVSTRRVQGATTRVRRIVRTRPVERNVELCDETVIVERIAPNGQPANEEALSEREYVMTDWREVPVVTKRPQLRELVVLRKQANNRVEVIRDVVRHTDVQIEQPERAVILAKDETREEHQEHHVKREEHREQHKVEPRPQA